jgi:pimeloyl-ACP methyl ester carboxylesterase
MPEPDSIIAVKPRRGRGRRLLAWSLAPVVFALVGLGVLFRLRPLASFELMGRAGLRASGFRAAQIDTPRGALTYFAAGQGPVLVLLHGANDQAGAWVRVARPLAAGRRVLIPDLPGHGRSAPLDGPLGVGDLVAGLEALLDAEARATRVTLAGNSLGGFLALIEALRRPERVAHVVLLNGAAVAGGGGSVELLPRTRDEARQAVEKLTAPGAPRTPDFVLDDLVRRAPASPLARLLRSPVREWLLDDRLGELRVPVSLVWGQADQLLPPAYAERVRAGLPVARLTPLPDCGHMPQRECPERLLAALEVELRDPPRAPETGQE